MTEDTDAMGEHSEAPADAPEVEGPVEREHEVPSGHDESLAEGQEQDVDMAESPDIGTPSREGM